MHPHQTALFLALGSALCFSTASLFFAHFARRFSSLWMNTFKALVALFAFTVSVFVMQNWVLPENKVLFALLASGILGLGIGDIFLLQAFARMGASRTLMLFSFQPVLIGFGASVFFGQTINSLQMIAIACFIACLLILSFERYKNEGHWEVQGLVLALIGVLFDNIGVLLSKWSFENSPDLNVFSANIYRILGALGIYFVVSFWSPLHLRRYFRELPKKQKILLFCAAFAGTFLSLSLYIQALKIGHLPTLSALVLAGPLISATLECLHERKKPSFALIISFIFLSLGLTLFLRSTH